MAMLPVMTSTLQAQVTTGALKGIVTDEAGKPIAGAKIVLESPALFQSRRIITDANGNYRALLLPVGNYSIEVSATGKLGKRATNVRVGVGSNLSLPFILTPLPQASCTVEVVSSISIYRDGHLGGCGRWTWTKQVSPLPLDPSFHRPLALFPGVSGEGLATSIRGAQSPAGPAFNQVQYAIDGVDVSDTVGSKYSRQGSQGFFVEPIPISIEDEQLQLVPNARYGGVLGGRVNLVTKSGSNTFEGDMQMDLHRSRWASDSTNSTSAEDSRGFEGFLSGPILKDRIWFALGDRKQIPIPVPFLQEGSDPIDAILQAREQFQAKVTGLITDAHVVSFDFHGENTELETRRNGADPQRARQDFRASSWALHWNGTICSNVSLEATLASSQRDHQRGQENVQINAKIYQEARGEHEIDLGGEDLRSFFRSTGPASFQNENRALWVNDLWTFNSHWSLMAGLRANQYEAQTHQGIQRDRSLEPRLLLKWDPRGNNSETYQASFTGTSSSYPTSLGAEFQIGSGPLKVPGATEFLLGYVRNFSSGGFARLNLVQREYRREFIRSQEAPNPLKGTSLRNASSSRRYTGFEASWEKLITSRLEFGGSCTLARSKNPVDEATIRRDQISTAYLTYQLPLGRDLFSLGFLTRYTAPSPSSFKQGLDAWTADLRLTAEIQLSRHVHLRCILQFENAFNHSTSSTSDIQQVASDKEPGNLNEAWKTIPTPGRNVARFSLGLRF